MTVSSLPPETEPTFADLGLPEPLLLALDNAGYKTPSPIQAATIPALNNERDVIGQAQTGTGKTAAFALPILAHLKETRRSSTPRAIVLAPTRELAIQVAESFRKYAAHLPRLNIIPIYGGQSYTIQLRELKRGVDIVVGTPGRVMDHIRRGTLVLDQVRHVVLDEADEMLRMGFIDDVEWILEKIPEERQIALFSATMPGPIRRIATRYLRDPEEIVIKVRTTAAETIRQRFWNVRGVRKTEALTRIIEAEPTDGVIVFARTKAATVQIADYLENQGLAAAALNGDMAQRSREVTVDRLKNGRLDVLVATDVAARGLDVQRISHVINFDIPFDTESYVHRIGRTGRAGREGEAILFVAPNERRMLKTIERTLRKPIEQMDLPTVEDINHARTQRFKKRITDVVKNQSQNQNLSFFTTLVDECAAEEEVSPTEIAGALAQLLQGKTPLHLPPTKRNQRESRPERPAKRPARQRDDEAFERPAKRPARQRDDEAFERPAKRPARQRDDEAFERHPRARQEEAPKETRRRSSSRPEFGMERFRIEVGLQDDAKPGNIVGAIANEAGLDHEFIGTIEIHQDHSTIDLPEGMPREVFNDLKKIWVCNKQLEISRPNRSARRSPSQPGRGRPTRSNDDAPRRVGHRKGRGDTPAARKKTGASKSPRTNGAN